MSKSIKFLVMWLIIGAASTVQAQDRQSLKGWFNYLKGEWKSELDNGSEIVEATVVWRSAAKGNASVGRSQQDDSVGIEIGGWHPDTKTAQINGYNSKGDFWQLEYKKISASGGEGPIRGSYEGKAYTGDFAGKVIDENHWEWTIKGKNPQGEDFTLSCKLTRKDE